MPSQKCHNQTNNEYIPTDFSNKFKDFMVLVYCFSVVINETSLLLSKFITNQKSYSKYFVFIILVKSLITCFHKNFLKMWTSQRFPLRYNYPVFVCVCILCLIDLNFIPHYSRHQLSLSSRSFFILAI